MVFEAPPIFTARSAKEHVVGLQRFGPKHPVGFRPVLRNQEHGAVSHAVVRPTDPAKIKLLVGITRPSTGGYKPSRDMTQALVEKVPGTIDCHLAMILESFALMSTR